MKKQSKNRSTVIIFMSKKILFNVLIFLFLNTELRAQDSQFSQFYAAPLYLNPAFTGATQIARAGLNYRNQWPSLDASFVTYSAYFDYFSERYNSGVGILVNRDEEGLAGLNSTSVSLNYAYQIYLTDYIVFRPGVQISYTNRSIDFGRLTFGNQFNEITGNFETTLPVGETFGDQTGYADFGFGGLLYSSHFWVGAAVNHINQPNQAFVGSDRSGLPLKMSVHVGYKFPLSFGGDLRNESGMERSIAPTAQYKMQGNFDQLDIGLYTTLEPLVIGLWYRGVPIDDTNGVSSNESLIVLLGLKKDDIRIGYSFDYTLSALGISSGGAHEISISYQFPLTKDRYRPPRSVMSVPCPDF